VSENGRLRHGEKTRGWGARRRRVLELPTLLTSRLSGPAPAVVVNASAGRPAAQRRGVRRRPCCAMSAEATRPTAARLPGGLRG